jgi:hypothetical protein
MADPRIDQWAQKLLILAEGSSRVQDLAIGREEARIIGEEINTAGGNSPSPWATSSAGGMA